MKAEDKTVFSRIVEGSVDACILGESQRTLSFLDHNPLTKGHALVITKEPIDHIDDCDEATYLEVFSEVHKLSKLLKKKLEPARIGIVVHGFEIPHAHVHVVPVYEEGQVQLAAKDRENPSKEDLNDLKQILLED